MKIIYGHKSILPFQGDDLIGNFLPKALPLGQDMMGFQPEK